MLSNEVLRLLVSQATSTTMSASANRTTTDTSSEQEKEKEGLEPSTPMATALICTN